MSTTTTERPGAERVGLRESLHPSALGQLRTLSRAMLRGFFRDRTSLFFTFFFPLMFLVVFGLVFRSDGASPTELGVVGTCALMKVDDGVFELTKMGVLEKARGRKAGELLLETALARASAMNVETLYLLTNAKCVAAIRLYEKLGFRRDAEIMAKYGAAYARCDVAMRYRG